MKNAVSSLRIDVFADDLTGAAEIAAIGFRHGLNACVDLGGDSSFGASELIVHDTDTRLDEPDQAARYVSELASLLPKTQPALVYKKTDSVLRGNVSAETKALAQALSRERILLLPANPSLGRTIAGGRYYVGGVPLDRTEFAKDPHHPARSAWIKELLDSSPDWPLSLPSKGAELPASGTIVGDASSTEDLADWARQLDERTLPAGGAEFFRAYLGALGLKETAARALPALRGPTLVIVGSLAAERKRIVQTARDEGWPIFPMPPEIVASPDKPSSAKERWLESIADGLERRGLALALSPVEFLAGKHDAETIRGAFSELAARLLAKNAFAHLSAEGGATASAIARALGWKRLEVLAEWAQGVITLRPSSPGAPPLFTMKPGSYSWPPSLRQKLGSLAKA